MCIRDRLMPQTSLEILNYLSSRIIKGIGPKTAARIVEHFGEQTLDVYKRQRSGSAVPAGKSPSATPWAGSRCAAYR